MKKEGFTLSLDITVDLTIEELWPDGDAPENPTVEDVQALIKKCGGAEQVVQDWDLMDYTTKFHVSKW